METEEKETQLTVLEEFKILDVYKYDVIETAAKAIETEVMSEVVDITNQKGRDREASLAFKVSKAKQRVIKMANASIEDARATVKGVTGERQRLEELFDEIRDKRKAGSINWDKKEQARKDGHRATILEIESFGGLGDLSDTDLESVEWAIKKLEEIDVSKLQEFEEEGSRCLAESVADLHRRKDQFKQAAELAAELKRLKQVEADALAAEEKLVEKEKADKLESDKKEQDRLDAIADKEKAEADAIKAKEEADKAEEKRLADIEQAKYDERIKIETEQAKEKADLEAARVKEENAELKRRANEKHRQEVRQAIVNVLSDHFEWEGTSVADFVGKLERGEVPELTINF